MATHPEPWPLIAGAAGTRLYGCSLESKPTRTNCWGQGKHKQMNHHPLPSSHFLFSSLPLQLLIQLLQCSVHAVTSPSGTVPCPTKHSNDNHGDKQSPMWPWTHNKAGATSSTKELSLEYSHKLARTYRITTFVTLTSSLSVCAKFEKTFLKEFLTNHNLLMFTWKNGYNYCNFAHLSLVLFFILLYFRTLLCIGKGNLLLSATI